MVVAFWIEGITLGLSTGVFCLTSCAMVFVPLLLSQKSGIFAGARVVGEFTLGRFTAYIAVGAVAGILGMKLENPLGKKIIGAAMILLSGLLILHIIHQIPNFLQFCRRIHTEKIKFPFLLGFLTGVNICPPFLLAVSRAADSESLIHGVELFVGFFLGTSVYMALPLPISFFGKWENVRIIAQITAALASIFFLGLGVMHLLN